MIKLIYIIRDYLNTIIDEYEYQEYKEPHTVMTFEQMVIYNFRINLEKQMFNNMEEKEFKGLRGILNE